MNLRLRGKQRASLAKAQQITCFSSCLLFYNVNHHYFLNKNYQSISDSGLLFQLIFICGIWTFNIENFGAQVPQLWVH